MSDTNFQKVKEDFVCEHCGMQVAGNGYTNHCSKCLWSKHVDVHPGDRTADCGGLMEPVLVEIEAEESVLTHRCVKCQHQKRNKVAPADNYERVLDVVRRNV